MKIALFDPYSLKFTSDMVEWWQSHGHEVKYQQYYNPELVLWADMVWFDTCDNNLKSATKPGDAILSDDANFFPWDMHDMDLTQKQIIVRVIDIEAWYGHHMESRWDVVDDVIFIAPHIMNMVDPDTLPERRPDLRVHLIPCAVNLDRWGYKERQPGFEIAVISERWVSKGVSEILQIALKLKQIDPRYHITWLGQRSDYPWEHAYRDEFVEHHQLNIDFVNVVDDVNEFLEDKNYLLHASHKEGHSYAVNEAAAKGIRPILHRFYGCDWLWGDSGWVWDSIDEAIEMILDQSNYNSQSYLDYIVKKGYTIDTMMSKISEVIHG